MITVALSDVPGDDPGVIASGITVPDLTPAAAAARYAERYLWDEPEALAAVTRTAAPLKIRDGGYYIAGSVGLLTDAAAKRAEDLGFSVLRYPGFLIGEAREQPTRLLSMLPECGSAALISGGETTVTLRGTGKGGRNQEMALSAALILENDPDTVFLSVGSDGTDGPTDAAGGVADGYTCRRMRERGVDPAAALADNDAYHALDAAGDLIRTGPTGTNVNDLTLLLRRA